MKDGTGPVEPTSRQQLYEAYVNCYLQPCTEVRPCHDARLLKNAAQYLLKEPEPGGIFTVFPFYQAVTDGRQSLSTESRKHLSAFIKATELLETLCINLFVQPWKKEIKTLKTFTGPFVYCLLPVLSSSTIKSVLASIGYLPHADTPQSEFRLSEDANPERAMQLGFELLLARVECYHFLELVEKDQLGQQEWMEVLQRRVGPIKLEEDIENKITGQKEEEKDKMKKEEADRKELPPYLGTRLAMKPQPKPQQCHLISVDQSIMEMQITYPDLAFRGRPLVPDKPHSANSSKSTSKDDHNATDNHSDDGKVAGPPKRDCTKGTKAAASTAYRKNDGSKADEVFVDNGSDYMTSGGTTTLGTTTTSSFSNGDRSRFDDEVNGPQALSLHITLRAEPTAGQSLKTGEQQQAAADEQTKVELSSLSSLEEQQELRELSERMGQLCMQETKEEVKRKEENKKEEKANNEEKERKVSTEREAEEQNLRKPVMETGSVVSHGANRCDKSFQHDPAAMKGPKQPIMCHSSPVTVRAADCERCKSEGSMGQEGEETGRREEDQLAQSFVIVEHHKK